jgi:hypothetical protein
LDDDRAVLVAAHRGPIRSGAPPELPRSPIAYAHLMRGAINGNQRQSIAIKLPRSPIAYAHLMRGAIDGNRWQSMAIDGNQWQ